MKLIMKLFAILLMLNLFIACNPDDDMEEELQYESQSVLEYGKRKLSWTIIELDHRLKICIKI